MKPQSRYEQMVVRYAGWVVGHRWLVLLLSLLVVGGFGAGASRLHFNTDYRVYFGPDNPQLIAFDEIQNIFAKNDNLLAMFEPREGDVFQPRVLEAMRVFTAEAWKLPYTGRVDSITNFQHTEAEGDDLKVEALLPEDAEITPERIAHIKAVTLSEPLLIGRIVSPSGHVAGVNVTAQFPAVEQQDQTELPTTVAAFRALRERILREYPEVKSISLSGSNMMSNAFTEASMHDMGTLVPAMYGVIILVMAVMLRSLWATVATMVVVIASATSAMGFAGWINIGLTPPSASSPQIITTLAVADCIHIYLTAFALIRAGRAKFDAIVESLRVNFTPVFLTSATTAVGFLSVNFTDSPPLKDLANITAAGVMLAWFFAITLLPALMAILPVRVPKERDQERSLLTRSMDRLGEFVLGHRRPLFWGLLLGSAALSVLAFRNEGNDLFAHYFDTSIEFRRDTDRVVENLTGFYTVEYALRCGESDCIANPDYLRKVEAFAQWWRTQPKVMYVGGATDIFKKLNKSMNGDDPAAYRVPNDRELAAQYLLLYEMSLPFGLDLNNQINVDKSATRFLVIFKHLKSKETREIEARGRQWLHENAPEMETHGVSPAVMFAHISKRNLESNFISLPISLAIISLLLVPVLRTARLGIAFLIPNLLPLGAAFGIWFLINGEVIFTQAIVLNMTVGIIVDDTIHFMTKYLRARREQNLSPEEAVRYSFHHVGGALVVTTLILTAGFMILAQSAFEPNSAMSSLTAITIVSALVIDLLLLPLLLLILDRQPKLGPASASIPENLDEAFAAK